MVFALKMDKFERRLKVYKIMYAGSVVMVHMDQCHCSKNTYATNTISNFVWFVLRIFQCFLLRWNSILRKNSCDIVFKEMQMRSHIVVIQNVDFVIKGFSIMMHCCCTWENFISGVIFVSMMESKIIMMFMKVWEIILLKVITFVMKVSITLCRIPILTNLMFFAC